MNPRFTVIIPSKDRGRYLRHTLETCIMQDYEPFEVIVSDDGSTDNTQEVVAEAMRRDSRIRYIKHDPSIGMRDNFESALGLVKPGYVMTLGGDDGLMPHGIVGMRDAMRYSGMELLTWAAPVFKYPSATGTNGVMLIPYRTEDRIVESEEFLTKQSRVLDYLGDIECPMIYVKGVASTRLVEKVRRRSPELRFYSSQTPDGYSGIVLAGEVARYAFSAKAFAIHGLSAASQGQAYKSNSEEGVKASERFYRSVSKIPMHHELAALPYSPLITLMTADYLLRAKDLPGWGGKFPAIDFKNLLVKGVDELAHGLYGEDRIPRELAILDRIAEQHGLQAFYREKVRKTMRRCTRESFCSNGFSTNVFYLNARTFGVENIIDAAYASQYLNVLHEKLRIPNLVRIVWRSVKYGIEMRKMGSSFPPLDSWIDLPL